jgi:hypothetical protein
MVLSCRAVPYDSSIHFVASCHIVRQFCSFCGIVPYRTIVLFVLSYSAVLSDSSVPFVVSCRTVGQFCSLQTVLSV